MEQLEQKVIRLEKELKQVKMEKNASNISNQPVHISVQNVTKRMFEWSQEVSKTSIHQVESSDLKTRFFTCKISQDSADWKERI